MATLQFASNLLLRFFHHRQTTCEFCSTKSHIIGIRGSSSSHRSSPTPPLLFPCSRRALNLSLLPLFYGFSPTTLLAHTHPYLELQRYTDPQHAFTLLRPSSWLEVHKPGAALLFEDHNNNNKGTNNVGVVVNPVRLATLPDFGTPQFVAQKLIHAEKRKESTKDAALVGVAVRSGEGGVQVYEFEYTVDSTRGGIKRVFSAAFVASNNLYILNISHSDKPDSPLDSHTRRMLEQVLHSFDAAAAPPPSL